MDFQFFVKEGFFHVLDLEALDHILFFIAVSLIFTLKEWKKALWLVTIFTVAHTFTFALSSYRIIDIDGKWVEFLIPITILIPLLINNYRLFNNKKNLSANYYFTFIFGLIHGLGFSSYFKMLLDKNDSLLIPLLEFALGIEIVQIIIVSMVVLVNTIVIKYFKIQQKYWVLAVSVVLLFKIIPMLIERFPF
ncbi:MAG TPA: HupE/UreJ family protein [Flavobacteriia bacterium]|nr:HupE/UreJ family protein [Flavobacteriia bacterium]